MPPAVQLAKRPGAWWPGSLGHFPGAYGINILKSMKRKVGIEQLQEPKQLKDIIVSIKETYTIEFYLYSQLKELSNS